jgi:hypothetical protein
MRTLSRVLAVATLAALAAAGCKDTGDATSDLPRPSRAFCEAAGKYDERITSQATSIQTHIAMARKIAEAAPPDVAKDAQTFLDALRRRAKGDTSVVDNPKVQRAADNVLRRAGQDCGWYQQKSSL